MLCIVLMGSWNIVTKTLLKTLVRKLERKNAHQGKIINSQADQPTSYLYDADNGAVPQAVKEASPAHFFYRGNVRNAKNILAGQIWRRQREQNGPSSGHK
ncbi:hypothetical protein B9Z55_028320 [Caenorhabditis nigoni]|uniref:Uncharacterized protein n=1 Tax=Caenorhabditis nigoni TaxID=1611254 RepID=A0A2G5SBV3_9PELO|nr:hypothetical protein B9Z55_028319 [Caenorhabditis nigoni]PIC12536.1 hypothetical protein B9Z55_028320 [Caenorhabditis nigoni]